MSTGEKHCVYSIWWETLCLYHLMRFHLVRNRVSYLLVRLFIPSGEKPGVYTGETLFLFCLLINFVFIPTVEKPCVDTNLWETLCLFHLVRNLVFISTSWKTLCLFHLVRNFVYTSRWDSCEFRLVRNLVFIPERESVYFIWWKTLCLYQLVRDSVFKPTDEKLWVYTNWWETVFIPSYEKHCVYTDLWETPCLLHLVRTM